jgi:L-asparaginase
MPSRRSKVNDADRSPGNPFQSVPPTISIIPLGGTVLGGRAAQWDDGYVPNVDSRDLLADLPHLAAMATLRLVDGKSVPSADLTLGDAVNVAASASRAVGEGAHAVVVLCGTDTLEEIAFALDLLWGCDTPLVITGAMRPPDVSGADGPANLSAAVLVALNADARGRGCLVVMNDEIHAARHLRKTHPSRPSAFASPMVGPIGAVGEGCVRFDTHTRRTPTIAVPIGVAIPPVAMVSFTVGDDGRLLERVVDADYAAPVIEGAGGGSVSSTWAEIVGRIAEVMPVVYSTRTRNGAVLERTYGGAGGEIDLSRRGVLPAGTLDGLKARIVLSLLLCMRGDRSLQRGKFLEIAGYTMDHTQTDGRTARV